jgi:uncharacterized protein YdhG (YjbR/CyaY superfamily)
MKNKGAATYKGVDDYIATQETNLQPMLEKIRSAIRSVVPKAEECISYMIPCYKQQGMLVGFGTHKKGCSFYTMNPVILRSYTEELKNFKYTGSTIHFDPKQPLPLALIKKIIKHRIKENEERALLKKDLNITKPKKKKK